MPLINYLIHNLFFKSLKKFHSQTVWVRDLKFSENGHLLRLKEAFGQKNVPHPENTAGYPELLLAKSFNFP